MSRSPEGLPVAVQRALDTIFAGRCGQVRIIQRSWRVRWHPRMHATTRRNRIYLRGTIEEFASDPALVLHEYFHVLEQWNPRRLTRWRYLVEYLWRGYTANRFEVETREFVARNLGRFQRLIAAKDTP